MLLTTSLDGTGIDDTLLVLQTVRYCILCYNSLTRTRVCRYQYALVTLDRMNRHLLEGIQCEFIFSRWFRRRYMTRDRNVRITRRHRNLVTDLRDDTNVNRARTRETRRAHLVTEFQSRACFDRASKTGTRSDLTFRFNFDLVRDHRSGRSHPRLFGFGGSGYIVAIGMYIRSVGWRCNWSVFLIHLALLRDLGLVVGVHGMILLVLRLIVVNVRRSLIEE